MDRDATELVTWREAAADLQIALDAPFVVTASGKSFTYFARLPQFGSQRGMLLMLDYYPLLSEVADANGYGFSCIEVGATYDREGFIEVLCDWGWAVEEKPPSWYKEVGNES